MKCNFLKNNKGEIVGALTPQGKKSELFDSLMNEFGSEKASELYAVAYSDDFLDVRGTSKQDVNPYSIKNFSFFASFGNPIGFLEAKKIGESNDRLPKTTQYNNTDFYTALEILPDGDKKLSIHFKHLEQNSNRGGGHAGLVFVFDKDKKINNTLVENLIPKVEKFRQDNFNKEGDTYRIKTNNPKEITPVDVRNDQIDSQQTEPTKEELLYFVTSQNREQAKLTTQQKVDLQNLILSVPNFNKDSFVSMFYDENGLFSLSREKLEKSGIYSPYEIQEILSDITIQLNLKEAVEGLANEEEITFPVVEDVYQKNENTLTWFGKTTRVNPYIIEQELIQILGGLSREDFNRQIDELPYKIADKEKLFQDMQQYVQAEVMTEMDGELVNVKEDDFEQLLYQTAKISDDVNFIESLNTSNITKEYEAKVLDNLGIDITGLSNKLFDAQFVNSLYEFAKSPNKQNTKDLVENYNRVFEKSAQNKIIKIKQNNSLTGHVLIENTQKTEEELFEQNSLIKTGENTYIKVEKKPLEQLYQDVATHFPNIKDLKTYIQQRIKGFKNAENAEAVELYKMFFQINLVAKAIKRNNNNSLSLAPNGQPSLLYKSYKDLGYSDSEAEQLTAQVYSDSFLLWSENMKRVLLDSNNQPKIYYHSSNSRGITEFKTTVSNDDLSKGGFFVTPKQGWDFSRTGIEYNLFIGRNKNEIFDIENEEHILKYALEIFNDNKENLGKINHEDILHIITPTNKNKTYYSIFKDIYRKEIKDKSTNYKENTLYDEEGNFYRVQSKEELYIEELKNYFDKTDELSVVLNTLSDIDRRHSLYKDYLSIERNGSIIERLGFKGAYVFESKVKNIHLYNTNRIKSATENKGLFSADNPDITDTVRQTTNRKQQDPTKFFPKMIKERNKNSEAWKNYYSNFEINSNGVVLKNNDPITQSIISLYETQEQEEPQTKSVVPLKSPYQKINETEIIVKNAQEKNIRVNDTVYELTQQQGNLSLYRQESAEKTNTNINDYITLSESPTEIKVKKYDTENVEGFEC